MNLEQTGGVATTTHGVLTHHLNSFGVGDIVDTMADYIAESKFLTSEGLLRGPEAIRGIVDCQRGNLRTTQRAGVDGTALATRRDRRAGNTAAPRPGHGAVPRRGFLSVE